MSAGSPAGHRYLPYAIGDGTRRKLYRCNPTMTSSLYEPNTPLLDCFQGLADAYRDVEVEDIQLTVWMTFPISATLTCSSSTSRALSSTCSAAAKGQSLTPS
jgi:hypothetical protein